MRKKIITLLLFLNPLIGVPLLITVMMIYLCENKSLSNSFSKVLNPFIPRFKRKNDKALPPHAKF